MEPEPFPQASEETSEPWPGPAPVEASPAASETAPVGTAVHAPQAPPMLSSEVPSAPRVDVDAIAADLADVEVALARLEAGTYWTDEVTGEPLPDELLAVSPTARRLPAG